MLSFWMRRSVGVRRSEASSKEMSIPYSRARSIAVISVYPDPIVASRSYYTPDPSQTQTGRALAHSFALVQIGQAMATARTGDPVAPRIFRGRAAKKNSEQRARLSPSRLATSMMWMPFSIRKKQWTGLRMSGTTSRA
jgi:hypothetical protein